MFNLKKLEFICPGNVEYNDVKDHMEMLSFSLATTPIDVFKQDTLVGIATGFFFHINNETFLVTCKHCIVDSEKRYYPDKIVIRLHSDIKNLEHNRREEIELYENGNPVWKEHSQGDLVMIEVNDNILKKYYIACFTEESIIGYEIEIGTHLLAVGYPKGIYDMVNNLPIGISAFLASKYGIWFNGEPCFLVDSYLPEGMSGSPILTATGFFKQGILVGGNYNFLVGILRGPLQTPYQAHRRWIIDDIGLYYASYADLLKEITKD